MTGTASLLHPRFVATTVSSTTRVARNLCCLQDITLFREPRLSQIEASSTSCCNSQHEHCWIGWRVSADTFWHILVRFDGRLGFDQPAELHHRWSRRSLHPVALRGWRRCPRGSGDVGVHTRCLVGSCGWYVAPWKQLKKGWQMNETSIWNMFLFFGNNGNRW